MITTKSDKNNENSDIKKEISDKINGKRDKNNRKSDIKNE